MVAKRTFDNILDIIQTSNLNFQLQISPFSASISLKKSLVKDRAGTPRLPPPSSHPHTSISEFTALAAKNVKLENDLMILTDNYEKVVDDCEAARKTIQFLQSKPVVVKQEVKAETDETLKKTLIEKDALIDALHSEVNQLVKKHEGYESVIENQKVQIQDFEFASKKLHQISDKFKKELNEAKTKFKKETSDLIKEHRKEVKYWKKELGEETKNKIKLEKKIKDTLENTNVPIAPVEPVSSCLSSPTTLSTSSDETFCSICANPIENYIPKFFYGEPFNPFCDSCMDDDTSKLFSNPPPKPLVTQTNHSSLEAVAKEFDEFLEQFTGQGSSSKYAILASELVKSGETTLDVSIADIRKHNNQLVESINHLNYSEVFPQLCKSLLNFVKTKADPELAPTRLLVRLV